MNARLRRNYQVATVLLIIAMVACFYIQYMTISAYNSKLHVSNGPTDGADCSAVVVPRGDKTASWYKQDTGLTGQIFDATLTNKTSDVVSSWTMTIDIVDKCFLNQFWNGRVEIHQHVSTGKEMVQTLTLADYDQDALEVDFRMDGSDLLIPLEPGDYLVYYPSQEFSEMPLDPESQTVVGTVFYYEDEVDLSNYHVDYYCHRDFTEGVAFVLFVIMGGLLTFVIVTYIIAQHAYRQAEKELELRKSGLSCMTELYAVIYLIDLSANTIMPVGLDEEADRERPKHLSPNDQLKNLMQTDAEVAYREIAVDFVELDTLRERLTGRNSIVFEYKSHDYGWCRIRFIAMDRNEEGVLEKVLFTIEQINEEKRELNAVLDQVLEAKTATEEQGALFEAMSAELRDSVDKITLINEAMLFENDGETALGYAREMYDAGSLLRWQMNNAADWTRIKANRSAVIPVEYQLEELVLATPSMARSVLGDEAPEFQTEVTPSLPRGLHGDEPKLRQSIANMLISAATTEGVTSVKLSIFGKVVDKSTLHMLVSVTSVCDADQVHGSPALPHAEGEKRADGETSGIGLVTARAMLALMGTQLNVTDARGGGQNLYFEIDQLIVDETPIGPVADGAGERGAR